MEDQPTTYRSREDIDEPAFYAICNENDTTRREDYTFAIVATKGDHTLVRTQFQYRPAEEENGLVPRNVKHIEGSNEATAHALDAHTHRLERHYKDALHKAATYLRDQEDLESVAFVQGRAGHDAFYDHDTRSIDDLL